MRSDAEMMGLIMEVAESDERIRAAYMNGSRTNPNAPKDMYRDWDIVYAVTETGPFLADRGWLSRFGTPLIVQEPDWNDAMSGGRALDASRRYAWLMLLDDGSRIDLGIELAREAARGFLDDPLTVMLLDKDGLLPAIPPPSDHLYHVRPPAEGEFAACCNNFWWCLNNVAKGIARDETPYAMGMLHGVVRPELDKAVAWYIGVGTDFSVSAGKMGKYFKRYLPDGLYRQYCATYSDCRTGAMWDAVFAMCDLFRAVALPVTERLGFAYRQQEEDGIREYLRKVRDSAYRQE